VHLRRAGIREADLDMVLPQGREQTLSAVHGCETANRYPETVHRGHHASGVNLPAMA
jgi:hypothetical protein